MLAMVAPRLLNAAMLDLSDNTRVIGPGQSAMAADDRRAADTVIEDKCGSTATLAAADVLGPDCPGYDGPR